MVEGTKGNETKTETKTETEIEKEKEKEKEKEIIFREKNKKEIIK